MMTPKVLSENLFDDWMDFPFEREFFGRKHPLFGKHEKNIMKTDVRELENAYEVDIDLPGFEKSEIQAKLADGYLTISAAKDLNKEEKDEEGRYIRQERYTGSCSRTFYVGEAVKQEDIKAKYENGILKLQIPKAEALPKAKEEYIAIEG